MGPMRLKGFKVPLTCHIVLIAQVLTVFRHCEGRSREAIQTSGMSRQFLDRHGAEAPRDDGSRAVTVRNSDGWY